MKHSHEIDWKDIVHRCFRCGYCKFTADYSDLNCPSYKKHQFETYSTGGRMWLIYGLLSGEIKWNESVANVIYACPTCGNCIENCRFDKFKDFLVDFIEHARVEAHKAGFTPSKQLKLNNRINNPKMNNPYGDLNSDNNILKVKYNLPDKADWIYFIGCTSNYRQIDLRDATIRFLKKANIDFTLIDEHCCCSPIIRTGQTDPVKNFVNYNLSQIKNKDATKVVTSCAGCYKTIKKDWVKYQQELGIEVYHVVELIKLLMDENRINFKSNYNKTITYHDPCHLGRHMKLYDAPREVYKKIPGINLIEMKRNRENAYCCGAGGGVKIGYPIWAIENSKLRLKEAFDTGASILSSSCPFCKTNLTDALHSSMRGNDNDLEVLDLIEIIDKLDFEVKS